MSELHVRLFRDSFNTPWGFRLQGGKDLGQRLSIQRVFSNSPAEGELQRGDLIVAISGRDGNELTHKQALDLIKHGGGQIQLIIQRPAPGRVSSTATFKPQRPRAPTLQVDRLRDNETPATEAYIKFHLERLQRLKNGDAPQLSPVYPTMPGPGHHHHHHQQHRQQHENPCYNPNFLHQYSPSSPSHPPTWAASMSYAPKKVSNLSHLGGSELGFVVDYGSNYGTVPRRRHSTQIRRSSVLQLEDTGGKPARVTNLSQLGGGGFDFGTDYCTLPRKSKRQSSQPPPPSMPAQQGGYGFQPKKVTLSSLGGGGPSFGSDYSHGRPAPVSQPVRVQTGGYSPGHNNDMLNRVQTSLDNISLSPRTPDYGYQAPPFAQLSPGGGRSLSTGERLDMEREQEKQRQQQAQMQPQQHYQPPPQQQQQASPQYYQAPPQQASPNYQQASPNYQQQQQQPSYVPTGVRIDQEMGEDGEEIGTPVWERRRTFMNAPSKPAKAPTGKQGAPKVPKPTGGQSSFTFGVDYSNPQPKTSSVSWKPQAVQRPVNVAPPQPQQAAPAPWQQQQQQQQPQQQFYDTDKPEPPPAWRNSLKTTGVKPWDCDLEYTIGQQEGPRSVGFQPKGFAGPAPAYNPAPAPPPPQQTGGRAGGGGGGDEGPQVVHLQYNSPMGLYSSQNVQETYAGQTKAMAAQGASPGGSAPAPAQKGPQGKDGDRDWTQSAVLRMIYEDEHRGMPQQRPQQQQQQQQRNPPPPPAPKPQAQFQQSFAPQEDEFGASDF